MGILYCLSRTSGGDPDNLIDDYIAVLSFPHERG